MKKAKPQILPPTKSNERRSPAGRYTKEKPSPFAFKPGHSGNPGGEGRPKDPYRLVSKAMRSRLNTRATDEAAFAAGLEPGASWAQVLGVSLINLAIAGDVHAARTVLEYTDQPMPRVAKLEVTGPDGEPLQPPSLNIVIVPGGAPQLHGPQPVAMKLPARQQSSEMLAPDLAERAANAVVAAVKAGKPCSMETVNACLPPGWVLAPDADVTGLEQAGGNSAHWEQLIRAGAVPK
ncbi:DUF5681 domain-containing protein [Paracidobacterium acidisoli]|uniref:DUF5681 domain-containing protein n=1 Tax=Paracidobacterium acidisoli TaxID=2303751 RepID=A0A372IRG3_9BACT|nr:DUF5681 domain-containing protein [Paracidobacterium acidisoli]MBT9331485.1 hypothetical protein [Paracidobacterium acidisoli]